MCSVACQFFSYGPYMTCFVAQNSILSVLTNKPYEAGSLCFYLDVPLCVCILLSV